MKDHPTLPYTGRFHASRPGFQGLVAGLIAFACIHGNAWGKSGDLQDYEGSQGVWLRTPAIETFVALEPRFRVLAVQQPGHASFLADSSFDEYGLRLACMDPIQTRASFEVGNQPAHILEQTDRAIRLRLTASGGLCYSVEISLETDRARMKLDYQLENTGDKPRCIACWSVMSFPPRGYILAPFGELHARRKLLLPWWTAWPQPGVGFGINALLMDASTKAVGDAYKIGVITSSGWIAFVRENEVIVSTVPFIPDATYPEDGANLALFKSGTSGHGRCETEQMSPLMEVSPEKSVRLSETLDLITIQNHPPAEADEIRKLIDQELSARRESPVK